MNELETIIHLLFQTLPVDSLMMMIFIITGYIFMPIFGLAFLLIAKKSKKNEKQKQATIAAVICVVLSIYTIHTVSKKYIGTTFTPYLIGEKSEKEASKHDVLTPTIRSELLKMTEETQSLVEKCNTPYQVKDKYVMPRTFELLVCLGVK